MRVALFALVSLALVALAVAGAPRTIRRLSDELPHGWTRARHAKPDHKINVVIAIQHKNIDLLEEWTLKVSNPNSPFFGHHLSRNAANKLTMNVEGLAAVDLWLRSHGVALDDVKIMPENFVRVNLTVKHAERLFSAKFHHYTHSASRKSVVRTEEYTIPAEISEHVHFVSILSLPTIRPRLPRFQIDAETIEDIPAGYTVPSVLYAYYNITSPKVTNQGATQSLYESLDQSYSPDDLTQFQKQFNLLNQGIVKVIGPNVPTACSQDPNNCVEANLDVQYIMAIAQNAPTTYWSIASSDQTPWIDWLMAVAATTNPPLVHSVSYGDIEPMGNQDEMNRFNQEAMKLGAQGITVVIASGDDGVANFIARDNSSACGFTPSFPATAQYVTAVGATMGPENNTAEIAETSDQGGGITTGGGFSTYFTQPSYQTTAVNNYLKNGPNMPPTSQFVPTGRAYPDVSIIGHNYIIVDGGQLSGGSGTSASAPVFAGMITLINSQRIAAGKAPLGFLNQILYQLAQTTPAAFHDITSGTNNCAAGDPGTQVCCQYGFTATTGWDPLTGLGSINYAVFSAALLALP